MSAGGQRSNQSAAWFEYGTNGSTIKTGTYDGCPSGRESKS